MRHTRPLLAAFLFSLAATSVQGAGMTTHALAAERAIPYVKSAALTDILLANRIAVLSGGSYPDSGYIPPMQYGETAHWERFINAYAAHVGGKPECGGVLGLKSVDGPCAAMIAHLMGAAAHGMMDETWDWMFEPQVKDQGEDPQHVLPDPTGTISSIEYAMDTIAIVDFYRWPDQPLYIPPAQDLAEVYADIGADYGEEQVVGGYVGVNAVLAAERAGAATDSHRVRLQLPWASSHFYAESGGVTYSAQAIAGYMDSVWQKVLSAAGDGGGHPAPRIVAVHPMPNETDVSCDYTPVRSGAGLRGGGSNRIIAVLSNSILHQAGGVPADAFQLHQGRGGTAQNQATRVATAGGFPAAGPYGYDAGTHTMMLYPAGDLAPNSWYTAVITAALQDHAGATLAEEYRWEFKTGPDCDTFD